MKKNKKGFIPHTAENRSPGTLPRIVHPQLFKVLIVLWAYRKLYKSITTIGQHIALSLSKKRKQKDQVNDSQFTCVGLQTTKKK